MAPFDKRYTTFYWSTIVNIALSCTVLSYLKLNNIMTLKSGLAVTQTGTIRKLGWVSYSPSIVTMALSCILSGRPFVDSNRIVNLPADGMIHRLLKDLMESNSVQCLRYVNFVTLTFDLLTLPFSTHYISRGQHYCQVWRSQGHSFNC